MIKINYAQEKMRKVNFVVPAIFCGWNYYDYYGISGKGKYGGVFSESLIPALVMIAFVFICFCILMKQSIKRRDDVIRIKEKGYRLDGQIVNVKTHTHTVRKSNGVYHESYYYTFMVKYKDPVSGEEVLKESIRTFTYYELRSEKCVLRLLNDEILVEAADAVEHRGHWSKKDIFLVVGFFAIIIALILFIVIPILGTL